jgi:hypothetical protein
MKNIELNKMGLTPIGIGETSLINGGGLFSKIFKGLGVGYFVSNIIEHWDEVKKGFIEGWNFDKQ